MGLHSSENTNSTADREILEREAAKIFIEKGIKVSRKGQNVAAIMRSLGLVPRQGDCYQVWEIPDTQTNKTREVRVRVVERFVQLRTTHADQQETILTIHRSLKPGSETETNDYATLKRAMPSTVEEVRGPQVLISADKGIEMQNPETTVDNTDLRSYLPEWGRIVQYLANQGNDY